VSQDPVRFFIAIDSSAYSWDNLPMSKTILLIDGENFIHKVKEILESAGKATSIVEAKDIDIEILFNNPLIGLAISSKIFYGAKLHYHQDTPTKSEKLIKSQRKLINNLKKYGYDFIMAGNVRGQKIDNRVIFREKGVDVRIAVDMVSLACDKKVKSIILCSSDSDLQPAIAEVKKRGVEVIYLGFENKPNKGLTFTTDRTILLRNSEVIEACKKKGESK
jgi:uncharacterized LabA/DUF88 family protein